MELEVKEPAELMQFLLTSMRRKNRDNVKSLLRNKLVLVNGRNISQFNHKLKPGDIVIIRTDAAVAQAPSRNLNIVFEDEHIIVIDKHAGLLSMSSETESYATAYSILSSYVKKKNPAAKIFIVHRLDRDTSGLMVFARSEKIQSLLQREWKENVTERKYTALVEGKVEQKEGTIRSYIYESKALVMHTTSDPGKGELAITHYKTLKANEEYSLVEVTLETGKKNQIRLHMKDMGHSIVGDRKYGASGNPIGRLGLHAGTLEFIHPVTREKMSFKSGIPAKFRRLI